MEKIIWVIGNNRTEMIDTQRKINSTGSMRAFCMLSLDALKLAIRERVVNGENTGEMPSLIILDYLVDQMDGRYLEYIKAEKQLAGVPLFFLCAAKDEKIDEECYQKGAIVVLGKPMTERGVTRVERAAWQYENTKQYERFLQEQATELRMAKEIYALNRQLENRNQFLHRIFGKYFSDDVLEIILNQPEGDAIGGVRKNVVILSSDLRGFTSIAEEMAPDAMTTMLNVYFGRMTNIIMNFHGTIIEFMGDGILAVFGVLDNGENFRENAMAAAVCMQNAMEMVNHFCDEHGFPNLEMGIGIHCGEAFIGNIGSEQMMRYNVLGSIVNDCSRIENYSVGGQILISEQMVQGIENQLSISNHTELIAKGIKLPLKICELEGIRIGPERYSLHKIDKVVMRSVVKPVILEIQQIHDKILNPQVEVCNLVEISMRGALIRNNNGEFPLKQYDDVVIKAKTTDGGVLFEQVYAKVMETDNDLVKIHFTHLNHYFKDFLKSDFVVKGDEMQQTKAENIIIREVEHLDVNKIEPITDCAVLSWSRGASEMNFIFQSNTKEIRALEFMDYFLDDCGISKGDSQMAAGMISNTMMNMLVSKNDYENVTEYITKRTKDYYEKCEWIYASEFDVKKMNLRELSEYRKKKIPWAYVKSTDFGNVGDRITIKSLENESGVELMVSDELYIMIGCRGEIYNISAAKFDSTYERTDEPLDIFKQMLDFLPEVKLGATGEFISIDEKAKLCYPSQKHTILAMKLNRRTKVFYGEEKEYFLGREGDYLAIRKDDPQDVYIIKKNIFSQTYEKV